MTFSRGVAPVKFPGAHSGGIPARCFAAGREFPGLGMNFLPPRVGLSHAIIDINKHGHIMILRSRSLPKHVLRTLARFQKLEVTQYKSIKQILPENSQKFTINKIMHIQRSTTSHRNGKDTCLS